MSINGIALGSQSFIAYGQQSAFGTIQSSLITSAFIRTGSIFSIRGANQPRASTAAIMPKASQLWQTMQLTDFDATLEYVTNDTALLPLLTAAWGRRVKSPASPAPFTYTYTMWNPPIDGGTDATPAGAVYNHGLTVREVPSDGTNPYYARVVQDICIDKFVLTMEANAQLRFQISGTGQKSASAGAGPFTFTDITGTTLSYLHANYVSNQSGITMGGANPPTAQFLCKSIVFTLENNLRYEPFLGAAPGKDLKLPTRSGWPKASAAVTTDYDDSTTIGSTGVVLMADSLANTKHNLKIKYYVDANNSIALISSGATAVNSIDDAKPVYSGEGVVGFTFNVNFYPNNIGLTHNANVAPADELRMEQVVSA